MHSSDQQRFIISNTPIGAKTVGFMYGLAQGGTLGQRTRMRIAIYLASRGHCVFSLDSLRACGRAAGMNSAEMNANQQCDSHNAMDSVCLRFVQTLLDGAAPPPAAALQAMYAVGYSVSDVLEVMAQVSANQLLTRMSAVIDAPRETANCGQMHARRLLDA